MRYAPDKRLRNRLRRSLSQRRPIRSNAHASGVGTSPRRQTQHAAIVFVRDDPKRAVFALGDVAHAADIEIKALLADNTLALQFEPHELFGREPGDEQIAAPGEEFAPVEIHVAGRDDWIPIIDRLLHAFAR